MMGVKIKKDLDAIQRDRNNQFENIDQVCKLIKRGPLARVSQPVVLRSVGGRVGGLRTSQVLEALSWMAGGLRMIDGFDARRLKSVGIIVYPRGYYSSMAG